jgi:hypothetical protein
MRVIFHGDSPDRMMSPPVVRAFAVPTGTLNFVVAGSIIKSIVKDVDQQSVKVGAFLFGRVSLGSIPKVRATAFFSMSSVGRASLEQVKASVRLKQINMIQERTNKGL